MSIEIDLKNLITQKFGTITNFSKSTGIPNSTLSSIFQRGVLNANVLNMITICDALAIDIDSLADGKIEPKKVNVNISLKEQQLLIAYNQHKEFQLAIDTLLGITENPPQRIVQTKKSQEVEESEQVPYVARGGQNTKGIINISDEDLLKGETDDYDKY